MSGKEGAGTDPPASLAWWGRLWYVVTYAMLAVVLGVALADRGISASAKAVAGCLSGVWAAWYWLFVVAPRGWRGRVAVRFVSFLLSVAVAAAASWMHPVFAAILFGYYGIAFGALPLGWAIPNVLGASVALAARFVRPGAGLLAPVNLGIILGLLAATAFDILLGLFVGSIIRHGSERQRMLEALESTRATLARAEREAGVLEERERLAREVHDTLAQGFTSIVLHLESAELAFDVDQTRARSHVDRALRAARDNLAEARRVFRALRPGVLERQALAAALERTARRWGEGCGVAVEFAVTGRERGLEPSVETALLRAGQEALANVRKHARAHRVSLTLSFLDDEVILDVQDDGVGFDASRTPAAPDGLVSDGYGLATMRERAELLGGKVAVESSPGEGTTVAVAIPVGRGEQEEKG